MRTKLIILIIASTYVSQFLESNRSKFYDQFIYTGYLIQDLRLNEKGTIPNIKIDYREKGLRICCEFFLLKKIIRLKSKCMYLYYEDIRYCVGGTFNIAKI